MLFWLGWSLSRLLLMTLGRCKVIGRENVPKKGGIILAPNHISYIDPPTVGCMIPRQTHFMAKSELFEIPVLGFLIRAVGSFPVRQHTADRAALKKAIELLGQGRVVCIFPEGHRNLTGELLPAQAGFGMIALKSKAPVVPVALIDTDRLLPPHSFFFRFAHVQVIYGKPMTFDDLYDRGMDREAIEEVGRRVMTAIAELRETAGCVSFPVAS